METPVFDSTRQIAINLRTPGGMKTVRVRFPSDDEWIGRQRRRKVLVKQLGRGISETTVANGEDVDAALVAKIRAGEDPQIDEFEAMKVVEQLPARSQRAVRPLVRRHETPRAPRAGKIATDSPAASAPAPRRLQGRRPSRARDVSAR